jgi:hypothetical protein
MTMKHMLMKSSLGMLALGLAATGAQASWDRSGYGHQQAYLQQQSRAYGQQIDTRQNRQAARIQDAMRAGHLTRLEFRTLVDEQHQIRAVEQHFRADGQIDTREFQRLDRVLDRASFNIRTETHDRQARASHDHHSWLN